jgi:DNA-nicking Smr family endonuclease
VIKKKDLSKADKEAWERFTNHPSNIYDKENKNEGTNFRKGCFRYDLHGFSLEEANQKVKEIIHLCVQNKYREILLITGKGLHSNTDANIYVSKDLSKLKFSVPEFINNNVELYKYIISISEASIKDGGTGAILIKLKNL